MTILAIQSLDPALPVPAPDADPYTLELNRRLREVLTQYNLLLEPLQRYKTDGQALLANDEESGGVEWATASGDIWRTKAIRYAVQSDGATAPSQIGVTFAATGTGIGGAASNGAIASTNLLTSRPRLVLTTGAATNNDYRVSGTPIAWWLGNAAGLGGFRVEFDYGVVTTQTTMRIVCGLGAAALTCTGDPSALTNFVAMACDAGDTNMQIMHNDGSGTATKVDLGSSFPKTANVVYRVALEAAANGSTVDYTVTRLDSAATATGTLSTNLPSSTTFLQPTVGFGNGSTAAAAAGCFFRFLSEQ